MREVEFKEVGMENYGPYIDPMVLPFENNTITLLTGPNGVGKTMALDAIPFTLFGITSKKMKGDDVVNNIVEKNCKTWVKFNIGSDKYHITRYHKYTKLGNTVIITKNGVDTYKGHKEVLPEIEKLICPQKAFMNTLMFGQKIKDFFTDLVDSDKKEIFRKILNLELYTLLYKKTDEKIKTTQTIRNESLTQIQVNQGRLEDITQQIQILKEAKQDFYNQRDFHLKELRSSLEDNNRLLTKWKHDLDNLKNQDLDIERITQQLSEIENQQKISAQRDKLAFDQLDSQKETKIAELQVSASKAKNEAQQIARQDLTDMRERKSALNQNLFNFISKTQESRHEVVNEMTKIYSESQSLEDRIHEIAMAGIDSGASTCPTCEQEITDKARDKVAQKRTSYQEAIDKLTKDYKAYEKKMQKLNQLMHEESNKIKETIEIIGREIDIRQNKEKEELLKIDTRLQVAIVSVRKLAKDQEQEIIDKSNNEADSLNTRKKELLVEKEVAEKILDQRKDIEKTISSIDQQKISIAEQIKFKEIQEYDESQLKLSLNKKEELQQIIKSYQESVKEAEKLLTILQFWKTSFSPSGIPSMLIDEAIPFMNKTVSEFLDKLSNGRYIVSFDTLGETKSGELRDKISVRVIDTHTHANSRIQLSGGQTRLIDIATILTLGELQTTVNDVRFNILLFDEIFDALDYDNVGYVCKVLNKLKHGKAIYIISHQHQEQLEADEQLTLS
jgi:exonuclease SbcC